MLRKISFFTSLILLTACGETLRKGKNSKKGNVDQSAKSILFSGTDLRLQSSNLYQLNLETEEETTILSGQSGDPALFESEGKVFLFNRFQSNSNYRQIADQRDDSFEPSSQKAIPETKFGDPHAILDLGDDKLLLAHYVNNKLVVINHAAGEMLSEIKADWDTGEDQPFRPQTLVPYKFGDENLILVVHQGLDKTYSKLTGRSQVFILKRTDDGLEVVDTDMKAAKIQGIKLNINVPGPLVVDKSDGSLYVAGLCAKTKYAKDCTNGIDKINFFDQSAELIYQIKDYYLNGAIEPGDTPDSFYISTRNEKGEKHLRLFSATSKSSQFIYDYKSNSGFSCVTYYRATKELYVGDHTQRSKGKFSIYKDNEYSHEMPVKEIPYSCVVSR